MTPDQRLRLAEVSERLAEVVIRDVDPDHWHAPDALLLERTELTLGQMTQQERGDAVWCRKAAAQSLALLARIEQLLGVPEGGKPSDDDPDPEAEIRRAEKAAAAALARCVPIRA